MINYIPNIAPTSVTPTSPKLSAKDKNRLQSALESISAIDIKMAEIENMRDAVRESARQFASGKATLAEAASLAAIPSTMINQCRGALRAGCKSLQREVVESVSDLVSAHREHIADDIADRARRLEEKERENALSIGINEEDFRHSGLWESLNEQWKRAKSECGNHITRGDLNKLAHAIGIEVPTAVASDDPLDLEVEVETGDTNFLAD